MTTIIRRRKLGMSSVKGICAASQTGIKWARNDLGIPLDNVYIRWGCTANVPPPAKVINCAKAIHRVNDKLEFRRTLDEHELCPATWFDQRDVLKIGKGIVIRKRKHAQGRGLWLVHTHEGLARRCDKLGEGNYYLSEYIPKVAEYRVFVVSGRAVCVAQKTPANKDDVAWNVAKGGRFDNVRWDEWNLKAVRIAIEGFKLSKLDFGGVDIMVDKDGGCTILEINSAPSLTSPYRQQCMAKALDYIVVNGQGDIPLINKKGGYLKFIHPSVCDRAYLQEGVVKCVA